MTFVKDINVVDKKMARNGRKMAFYHQQILSNRLQNRSKQTTNLYIKIDVFVNSEIVKTCDEPAPCRRFLCRMTETMKAIYQSRNLKLVTDRKILNEQNLLSYKDFYEFSRPNKPLTARHTFCNMLICQSGLSPGMA